MCSSGFYAAVMFFSRLGAGLFFFINTWVVTDLSGSPSGSAISLLVAVVPSIFFSMILGSFADRFRPVKILIYTEFFRFLTLFLYAGAFVFGGVSEFYAYLVSFLMACLAETQLISWRVIIGNLPVVRGLAINSLSVICGQSGVVVGAMGGGVLYFYFGSAVIVFLASFAFLITMVFTRLLVSTEDIFSIRPAKLILGQGTLVSTAKLMFSAFRSPVVLGGYALVLVNTNVLYLSNALLAPFVQNVLGLSAKAYGLIDSAYSVGAIIGGLLMSRLVSRYGAGKIIVFNVLCLALSLSGFSRAESFYEVFFSFFGVGIGCQSSIICLVRAQSAISPDLQGKVFGLFNTITGCFGVLTFFMCTQFSSAEELRWVFEVLAVFVVITLAIIVVFLMAKFYRL